MSAISIFDIFKIGVGPSSSHTMGPMKAAQTFAANAASLGKDVNKIRATVFGSLAFTGKGHATDSAILLGLSGWLPDTMDPDKTDDSLRKIHSEKRIDVPGIGQLSFDPAADLIFNYQDQLPRHTNAMRFEALDNDYPILRE